MSRVRACHLMEFSVDDFPLDAILRQRQQILIRPSALEPGNRHPQPSRVIAALVYPARLRP
ncbi:MAG: hypothetical protein ACR2J8_15870, partial [Thermomicrobiales bacterium]